MIVKTNPEFGVELALTVPYAYWLHLQGQLETVVTSKGMKPFYYFCNDVREEFTERTIDNVAAGLDSLPNNWIHHNAKKVFGIEYNDLPDKTIANGVLDYTQWACPPYKEHYKQPNVFSFETPIVFISNKYNLEHGEPPSGYFDIECLYNIFTYLTEKGYTVIYKRATNKEAEFAIDQNEQQSISTGYKDIEADIEGIGKVTDIEFTKFFDNVFLFDKIVERSPYSYNETQLRIMANCERFITVCGGNSILSSMFGGTVITYVHKGKELRPGYFGPNSYFRKLSGANVIPIYDVMGHVNATKTGAFDYPINTTGKNDYTKLIEKMKVVF